MPENDNQPVINPWIIAVAVMLGTFMEVLDTTVVNVSLPHIAGSLSATVDESTWVLTSYLVSNAIILPMTGWLSNTFGRKRVLMTSVAGFTLASVACGLAPSLPFLIIFRVIQGATGGGLQPLSQAIMLEAFPPQDRGKAMAFWGLGIVVAPMLGPVMGGWITDNYSWRWVFYINLPVGIAALIMAKLFIFDPSYIRRAMQRIDYWGIGLLSLGMAGLQIMLDKGQEEDWFSSHFIDILAIMAIIGLVGFVVRELVTEHPIVDLRVFKVRTYATGVFLMTSLGFVLYGSLVLIPIFLQTLLGYPSLQAGWAMLPRGLGSFIAMPFVGLIMSKVEPRKLLIIGFLVCAYSLYDLSNVNLNAGYWDVFWPQFIQGISMGFIFVPLTTATHDPIPKEQMGNATSLFNVLRNIGGSVGIAGATTMVARHTQTEINILGKYVNPYNPAAQQMIAGMKQMFMGKGSDAATATQQAYGAIWGMVQQQASMVSFVQAFRVLGFIFVVVVPLIFLMRRPKHSGASVAVH
ncbi:MAG TPA: DHA2 family efflux MFS transporter permease subunit [Terriglobales bacterium]|nr:DHA2 family efflux MFS transporter permease subunit [Terriglobales bacterium]